MTAPQDPPSKEPQGLVPAAWLAVGPLEVHLPALAAESGGKAVGYGDLLPISGLARPELRPAAGDAFHWPGRSEEAWRARPVALDGLLLEPPGRAGCAALHVLFTHVELERFAVLRIQVDGPQNVQVHWNGSPAKLEGKGRKRRTGSLEALAGKHALLVTALVRPGETKDERPLRVSLGFEKPKDLEPAAFARTTLDPARKLHLGDLLDTPTVTSAALGPDGEHLVVQWRRPEVPAKHAQTWTEVRRFDTGEVVFTTHGRGAFASWQWGPDGRTYAYVARHEGKATLWVNRLGSGEPVAPLRDVEELGTFRFAPDGKSLFYTVVEKEKKDEVGVERMRGLPDRWPTFRHRSWIHQVAIPGAADDAAGSRRLTAGALATTLEDVHPAGTHLLFTRTRHEDDRFPFSRVELHELDLATLEVRRLAEGPFLATARYAPDGERIAITGGPSTFGGLGRNVPEGRVANDYDGQVYLLHRATGAVHAITRAFDPSVEQVAWCAADGALYLRAEDGTRVRVFRWNEADGSFTRLALPPETVAGLTIADRAARMVYLGSSAVEPPRLYAAELHAEDAGGRVLVDATHYPQRHVRLGRVEDFDVEVAPGRTIEGRVHLPPDFDPSRRWPAIVYYYGGTSPVGRAFGGRYPKNVWCARGYVVYVLQPSGATGWGQEFSSRHVNDWGRTVVGEIDAATQAFLDAHPYVDPARVGCIGASYGGFTTMLLLSHTQRFAAAVSHAGISSIASYWGEGYWGYLYSAIATAESYPWNRTDLYVEQSALFRADRIRTPLLLLHGTADTNVPVGESEQMYTALRILGRDVEFVKVQGEDHHVLAYEKRVRWSETILAWFDWKLKGEPEHWERWFPDRGREERKE